jgi:hypothetical protein
MATNKGFDFIHPQIDIYPNLSDFKTVPQVRWTGNNWYWENSITVGYGPAAGTWNSTTEFPIRHQKDLYTSSQDDGFRVFGDAGLSHESLFLLDTNSRWMPASVFNGVGFETYYYIESNNSNHQVYVGAYGVVFRHRTNSGRRIYGWDTGNSDGPGHSKYRFDRITSTNSAINTIRSWGRDWLLQGLLLSVKTKGSGVGTTQSYLNLYNLKFGSKYSLTSDTYRVHPLALRPYTQRDMHPLEPNKFAYFKPSLF